MGWACRSTPSGWNAAGSFGRRSRTASFRSRCRNSLTCSRASIGAIRYTLADPRRRAECGVLTHRGKLSLRITRDYDSVVAWRRQLIPLGQKIEAIEGIVPVRRSLVGRCAAIGMTQQRVADLPIFVLDCRESHSQKQAQLKVGAFEPQPSVSQN